MSLLAQSPPALGDLLEAWLPVEPAWTGWGDLDALLGLALDLSGLAGPWRGHWGRGRAKVEEWNYVGEAVTSRTLDSALEAWVSGGRGCDLVGQDLALPLETVVQGFDLLEGNHEGSCSGGDEGGLEGCSRGLM